MKITSNIHCNILAMYVRITRIQIGVFWGL